MTVTPCREDRLMGRTNRAKRAGKQRQAARERAERRGDHSGPSASERDDLELFCHVVVRRVDGTDRTKLDELLLRPPDGVAMAASALLEPLLALIWDGGW